MFQFVLFALSHYAVLCGFALLSYGLGRRLTRRCDYQSGLEQFVFCTGLGLGAIALLLFGLGILGALYLPVVATTIVVLIGLCSGVWRELWGALRHGPWKWTPSGTLAVTIATIVVLPVLVLPLYPPTAFDAIMYHLPYARTYVENHQVAPVLTTRYPVFPQVNEMLFTLSLLFFDDVLAQLFQLLMTILVCLALYSWGAQKFSKEVGFWAAGLWLANPIVIRLSGYAFIDIGLTCFATLSAYAYFGAFPNNRLAGVILAGIFAGLAAGSKYSGLFFVAAFALPAVYLTIRQRTLRYAGGYALAVLAAGVPWYAYNAYHSGNPFFPFFAGIFDTAFWNPSDTGSIQTLVNSYGTGLSVPSLLGLPWALSIGDFPEKREISPIYFAALPLLLAAAGLRHRARPLIVLTAGFVLFWFASAQVVRYLLAILPVFGLAVAAVFDSLSRRLPLPSGQLRAALAGAGALALAFPGLQSAVTTVEAQGRPPASQEARNRYFERNLPAYGTYQYVNGLATPTSLYALYSEEMVYFAEGRTMGDWFGPARFSRIVPKLADGEALYRELRLLGADHFLVRTDRIAVRLPDDPFFQSHFRLVHAEPRVQLFALSDQPLTLVEGEPLFENSGFEQLVEGWPAGWSRNGTPVVDRSGANSFAGQVALRCDGITNVISQGADIMSGATYVLSAQARSAGDTGSAWLQLGWQNQQGASLPAYVETILLEPGWRQHRVRVVAPAGASTVTFMAIPHQGTSLWLDDVSLVELRYAPDAQ